jgi:hypothetical protein
MMDESHEYDDDSPAINPALLGWGVAAVVIAILGVTFNHSAMVFGASFFMKCLAAVVGAAMGLAGALLGDAIRKFAHPDAVFTSGGMFSLIGIKLFWLLGPQTIGLLVGVGLGCSLVLR